MNKPKLLVVDDEKMIADSLVRVCSTEFEAKATYGGVSAIAMLESEPFDLVICDFLMGDLGGDRVLTWLKEERPDTLVVMMTAYSESAVEAQLMAKGATQVMLKPFPDIFAVPRELKRLLDTRGAAARR